MGICFELNCFESPQNLFFAKYSIDYNRPNFSSMIAILKDEHAMTAEMIAFLLPVAGAGAVAEWVRGAKPNFEAGEAFMELWKIITGKTDLDIPRINHSTVAI